MAFSILSESSPAAHAKIASLSKTLCLFEEAMQAAEDEPTRRLLISQIFKWRWRGLIDHQKWQSLLSAVSDPLSLAQKTLSLLDNWRIPPSEYDNLKKLILRGELSLVYDYLNLQRGKLTNLSSLATALKRYVGDSKYSSFPFQIEIRRILQEIYSWFVCLPAELGDWEDPRALKKMEILLEVNLHKFLKQPNTVISPRKKLFMEEFLHNLQQSKDKHGFLKKNFPIIEELDTWEEILKEFQEHLNSLETSGYRDKALLEVAFLELEAQVHKWHERLGRLISPLFAPPLTDVQQAIKIGNFRFLFQHINDSLSDLKARLLCQVSESHLCCSCHFADSEEKHWPLNNRVFDLTKLRKDVVTKPLHSSLLIFTCGGGAGHLSAAKAMAHAAKGHHHILVASTLEETLAANDLLKKMKFDLSQEKLYNYLLKNEEFEWMKLVTSCGPIFLLMMQRRIERLIRLEVLKQNPDVLISCIPIFNPMFLNIAKELELPLLIVTTDLDTGEFIKGMTPAFCDVKYPHYLITLAYDYPEMRSILENRIPKEKIKIAGFPLREGFTRENSEQDLDTIRKKFDLLKEEKLLIVMMGGNAGLSIEKYAEILASCSQEELPDKVHVLCLCGDKSVEANQEMRERIHSLIPKSPHCRIQGIFMTDHIPELMTLAHAIISKPGGCTTNEALSKLLPVIFHAPFALMSWEKFNMEFCIQARLGFRFQMLSSAPRRLSYEEIIYNKRKLLPILKEAFQRRDDVRSAPVTFEKKNFPKEFLRLIEKLVNES